jgi:hypothetical protein
MARKKDFPVRPAGGFGIFFVTLSPELDEWVEGSKKYKESTA